MNLMHGIRLSTIVSLLSTLVVIGVSLPLTTEVSAAADKLDVCHVTNVPGPGDGHVISIADPAWPAHEAHGDKELWEEGVLVDWDGISCHVSTAPVAPIAVDYEVTTPVDTAVTIDVLANDIYDDPVTVSVQEFPQNGILGILDVGIFEYTPNAKYVGTDSLDYRICVTTAVALLCSDTATVTITVVGP